MVPMLCVYIYCIAPLCKLKIYAGPDHPHEAQQPEKIEIEGKKA